VTGLRQPSAAILTLFLLLSGAPSFGAPDEEPVWKTSSPPAELADITVESLDGETRHLYDYPGKVVLLSFWATWCAPCIAELPTLIETQAALGADAIAVMAVSEDRGGRGEVEKFASRHPDLAPILKYLDPSHRAAKALGIGAIPTTILIDRQGRELGRLVGGADWRRPEMRERIVNATTRP
jgi:thiol-disulfide isomerase/thioredoxin